MPRRLGSENKNAIKASRKYTIRELGWIAGFLEGEAHFGVNSGYGNVTVSQNHQEPLLRLQELLGGSVKEGTYRPPSKRPWIWNVTGSRARGIMLTVYPLMSDKRQEQIRAVFVTTKQRLIAV